MIKREFTRDEIIDQDLTEVDSSEWRHGRRVTYVFEDGGKYWMFTAEVHYEDGMQLYGPIKCTEVHQVERTVKVWETAT